MFNRLFLPIAMLVILAIAVVGLGASIVIVIAAVSLGSPHSFLPIVAAMVVAPEPILAGLRAIAPEQADDNEPLVGLRAIADFATREGFRVSLSSIQKYCAPSVNTTAMREPAFVFNPRRQTGSSKVHNMLNTTTPPDAQPLQDLQPHLAPLAAAEIVLAEPVTIAPEDDRQTVAETAARIRNLQAQVNITEKRVRIGGEFRALRNRLPGWRTAFDSPNPFDFSRRIAERHIEICEAFGGLGHMWPKLPHTFRALHLLATLRLSDAEIAQAGLSGEISPTSTEGQIWKLGAALGKIKAKSARKKFKSTGAAAVPDKKSWDRMSLDARRDFLDTVGVDGLRAAMSPELCDALRRCYEKQLARTNPRVATLLKIVPKAEVLAPPRPDLVSSWDAAATEERARLARERGNQIVDAA